MSHPCHPNSLNTDLDSHVKDTTKHITAEERTAWNGKQATITGGASTIVSSNLTASRALVSDSKGKVVASAVTSTELGYLDGVTSNVQGQLNTLGTNFDHQAVKKYHGAPTYSSLAAFWEAVETLDDTGAGCFMRMRATGGWCPLGWCRVWASWQNRVGNGKYGVTGAILATDGNMVYFGKVNNGLTNYTDLAVSWTCLTDYFDDANIQKGFKFGTNQDGTNFEFRPYLPNNILQITLTKGTKTSEILSIESSGKMHGPWFGVPSKFFGEIGYGLSLVGQCISYQVGNFVIIYINAKATVYTATTPSSSDFNYGFNLTAILKGLDLSSALNHTMSMYKVYYSNGALITDRLDYSGSFDQKTVSGTKVLTPNRYYANTGTTGAWPGASIAAPGNNGDFYDAMIICQ